MSSGKQHKDNPAFQGTLKNNPLGNQEGSIENTTEPYEDIMPYPAMYQVILLNDDFTPMEFVMELLERVFFVPPLEARAKMLQVHQDGQAVCGIYTYDVAETKVIQVMDTATQYNYPLKCIMRKETRYAIKKS